MYVPVIENTSATTSWALITAEGERRIVSIASASNAPALQNPNGFAPQGPMENTPTQSPVQPQASEMYAGIPAAASQGWPLLDRLAAEIRWLQYRARVQKRQRAPIPRVVR